MTADPTIAAPPRVDDPTEQQVTVVFDVYADTPQEAATLVRDLLASGGPADVRRAAQGRIDAWWFPEAWAKAVDGNDRDAMHLVSDRIEGAL